MERKIIFGLLIIGIMGLTAGCGERYWDEVIYSNPNWTPEGLIYVTKRIYHHREYGGIGGTYNEYKGEDTYYVTMDTNGSNETILPYTNYPYFSPKGTYVALISGETISIVRRSDGQKAYEFTPTTENIKSLDWGPGEERLVYLKSSGEINVVNIDGAEGLFIASSGEAVSWKYGNKIAFEYQEGLYFPLAVINYDGSQRVNFWSEGVSNPCISSVSSGEVYGTNGNSYGYINIETATPEFTSRISIFDGYKPRLSPNANKIVYSNYGGGVWILNIDGTELRQLK